MIRAAAEEDISRILEIEQDTIVPPWTQGGLLREIYRDDSFFALAIVDTLILGFIILRRMEDEGELLQIAVDIAHQRCGVADSLMETALVWASGCGIVSLYLEVRRSNESALALYRKHGFKQVGARKDYYSNPIEDAVIMMRHGSYSLQSTFGDMYDHPFYRDFMR